MEDSRGPLNSAMALGAVKAASPTRGVVKFLFWLAVSLALFSFAVESYVSGQMVHWYYYRATIDGYAVNDALLKQSSPSSPVYLTVVNRERVDGPVAVPIHRGSVLPLGATGVIGSQVVAEGKHVVLDGERMKVMFTFEDTALTGRSEVDGSIRHGTEPNPWSGLWNLGMVLAMGLSLGLLADGFTDMIGLKLNRIQHDEASR